jgi:hypothetical protein
VVVGLDGWWIVNGSCEVDGSGFGDLPVGGGHGMYLERSAC